MPDTPTERPFRLRYAAVSDVGRHRKENQDSGYASDRLLVVADGVGGAAYGDVASATAVQLLRKLDDESTDEMLPLLAGAVHRIHDRLAEMVENDKELDGTSTTVTAALFDGRRLGFAHVGDSRAYLLRGGVLRQITQDHTFVQTLVDEGRITEDEARVHPHRNIILRAVDGVHDTAPDLFHLDLEPGDRVMLCSDGCPAGVVDEEIQRLLHDGNVDAAAVALVQAALEGGSTDNVTVIVAEAVDADAADDPELAAAATGPMLVGAAAAQPRRGGGGVGRGMFRRQHDTDEIDPVPAAEPVDPEELRYAPRPPRRFLAVRRLVLVLVPLSLLITAGALGYAWTQNQYFVAVGGDQVAIYQGVQMDLPVIELSSVHQTSTVAVADLPPFDQQKVEEGIVAQDLTAAELIVANLEEAACRAESESPSPSPTPSATPNDNPDANPTDRPSATASTSPSPSENGAGGTGGSNGSSTDNCDAGGSS